MGIDNKAIAVLGVVLPGERFYTKQTQSHQAQTGHVSGKKAYCPECGQKNERATVLVPLFEGGEDEEEDEDPSCWDAHIGRCKLQWSTDNKYGYLGVVVSTESSRSMGADTPVRAQVESLTQMMEVQAEVEKVLTPLGLWEPEAFGLWAVLYCSY